MKKIRTEKLAHLKNAARRYAAAQAEVRKLWQQLTEEEVAVLRRTFTNDEHNALSSAVNHPIISWMK